MKFSPKFIRPARCAALVLVAVWGAGVRAQDGPTSKPFRQWSKAEATKVITDSPWARAQSVKIRVAGTSRRVAGGPVVMVDGSPTETRTEMGGAEAPIDFTFTLLLRSSRHVREALVRLKQLEAGYDKMSAERQAAFDAEPKVRGLLECPACADNYVVTLSSKSKESPGADAVHATFKGARLADLQRYVYLANDRGGRRKLVHFVAPKAPGDEAVFFFPRFDDEETPLLTPESRELVFNLSDNEVNAVTNFRVNVPRLVRDGRVDF